MYVIVCMQSYIHELYVQMCVYIYIYVQLYIYIYITYENIFAQHVYIYRCKHINLHMYVKPWRFPIARFHHQLLRPRWQIHLVVSPRPEISRSTGTPFPPVEGVQPGGIHVLIVIHVHVFSRLPDAIAAAQIKTDIHI